MATGRIEGLHRTPTKRGELERLTEAAVVADLGIEGDHHGRPGSSRQVVLVEAEVLDALDLQAGDIREQLTVRGVAPLHAGDLLEIGAVRLEVVKPRVPCQRMDGVRPGLRRELEGQAGWCTRVVAGGRLGVGDTVVVGRIDDPEWLAGYRHALAAYEAAPRPQHDGFDLRHELAQLAGWNDRAVERIAALAGGAPEEEWTDEQRADVDAQSVQRLVGPDTTTSEMYRVHDTSATAVIDAARVHGAVAESWLRSLAANYLEHAAECA